jgi:hypothetical protein
LVHSAAGDEPACLLYPLHLVLVLGVVVVTQRHCLAIDARHAPRVSRIGHNDLSISDEADVGSAPCKLILMGLLRSIPLCNQFGDDTLEFLLADWTLHYKIHLVEGLHQRFVVLLLLKSFIQVKLKREVLLHVLGDFSACVML